MSNEVVVDDFELESFLAQLDEENEKLMAEAAKQATPAPTPEPVKTEPVQEPVVQEALIVEQTQAGPSAADDFDLEAILDSVETVAVSEPAKSKIDPADLPDTGVDTSVATPPEAFPTQEQMVKSNLAEVFKKQREALDSQPQQEQSIPEAPISEPPTQGNSEPKQSEEMIDLSAGMVKVSESSFRSPEAEEPTTAVKVSPSGLHHFVDVAQFRRDIRVNDVNLDSAMFEQSGLRAFYGANAAYAEAQHSKLKLQFEVLEAQLFDHHRKALAATGEKVTEKMVESAVKMDKRWLAGKNKVIEAETIADISKTCVSALVDRRDMIIQIGADRRDEGKGALRVLAKQQAERNSEVNAQAAIRQAFGK